MNCVNYKNKDVQELAEELNLHPALAAAKIAVWQRNNGVDKWPTKEDLLQNKADEDQEIKENIVVKPSNNSREAVSKSSVKESIGKSYGSSLDRKGIIDLKSTISKKNNYLLSQNADYHYELELKDGTKGNPDKNGWSLIKVNKPADIEGKISRLSARSEAPYNDASIEALKTLKESKSYTPQQQFDFTNKFSGLESKSDTVVSESAPKIYSVEDNAKRTLDLTENVSKLRRVSPDTKMAVFSIADNLSDRTGINYKAINAIEAKTIFPEYEDGIPGIYDPKTKSAYIVSDYANETTALHEIFGHPFLESLRNDDSLRSVYDNLLKQSKLIEGHEAEITDLYKNDNLSTDILNDEIINAALDKEFKSLIDHEKNVGFVEAVKGYFKAFTDTIKHIFGIDSDEVDILNKDVTLSDIAKWALYGEGKVRLLGGEEERESIIDSAGKILDAGDDEFYKLNNGFTVDQYIDNFGLSFKDSELLKDWLYENNPKSLDDFIKGVANDLVRSDEKVEAAGFNLQRTRDISWTRGDMLEKAMSTKDDIISGLKSRLNILKNDSSVSKVVTEELNRTIKNIERESETKAAMDFISYALNQGSIAEKTLNDMTREMSLGNEIDAKSLMGLYNDFLKMFNHSIDAINEINDNKDSIYNKHEDKKELEKFQNQLQSVKASFQNLRDKFTPLLEYSFRNWFNYISEASGSTTSKDEFKYGTFVIPKDVSLVSTFIGSPTFSRVERIRALSRYMTNVQNQVRYDVNNSQWIPKLTASAKAFSKGNPYTSFTKFMESHEGKFTGFLVSPLKYGLFDLNRTKFLNSIKEEFNLQSPYDTPIDPVDYSNYIKKIDDFYSKHSERRFVPEYYELKHNLSPVAVDVLDEINAPIMAIYDKYTKKNGVLDVFSMSKEDKERLFTLKKDRAFLASDRQQGNGLPKTGVDLEIAKEIAEYNRVKSENLKYKVNRDAFNSARDEAKKELSPENYQKWIKANTKELIDQKFWDQLDAIEKAEQAPEWQALYDQKQSILKSFRDPDTMGVRVDRLESSRVGNKNAKDWVDEANDLLAKYKQYPDKKSSPEFKDIAKLVKTKQYLSEYEKYSQMATGSASEQLISSEWFRNNHIIGRDGVSETPKPYWTKIEPIDQKLIDRSFPNSVWSTFDEDSPWLNKNYDNSLEKFGIQPKKSLYDNSKEYNNVIKDPLKKDFYDKLVNMKTEADSMYSYANKQNPLKMPQISAGSLRRMFAEDNIGKGIWNEIKRSVAVKSEESDFGGEIDSKFRPDNSPIKNLPTFYKRTLENPNAISKDLIHSYAMYYSAAANFRRQSEALPDIQVYMEAMNRTSASNKSYLRTMFESGAKKNISKEDIVAGAAGNTYALRRAQGMVDREMFGIRSSRMTVHLPFTGYSVDIAKPLRGIYSWFRAVTLGWNPLVAFSNFTMSELSLQTEADIAQLINRHDLRESSLDLLKTLPEALTSLTTRRFNNKLVAMMRLNDISINDIESSKGSNGIQAINYAKEHLVYNVYTAGDFIVKSRILGSVYRGYKLSGDTYINRNQFATKFMTENPGLGRKEATKIFNALPNNLWDAFTIDKKSGQLTILPEFRKYATDEVVSAVNLQVRTLSDKLHGMLSSADRNAINTNAIASSLMLFRGWMLSAAQDKFSGKMYSYAKEQMDEGQYITPFTSKTGFKCLLNVLTANLIKPLRETMDHADAHQVYNVKKTANEIKYMFGVALLCSLLKPSKPDKDKEKPSAETQLYVLAMRTLYQQNAVYSPYDALSILKSPTAATNQLDVMGEILSSFEDGTYGDAVGRGQYKGLPKWEKQVIKLTPIGKSIYEYFLHPDLEPKVKYMQKNIGPIFNIAGPKDPSIGRTRGHRKPPKVTRFL